VSEKVRVFVGIDVGEGGAAVESEIQIAGDGSRLMPNRISPRIIVTRTSAHGREQPCYKDSRPAAAGLGGYRQRDSLL